MGGRWAAAAVVVVGLISSMSVPVEGDALGDTTEAKASYMKIVNGGVQKVGDPCSDNYQIEIAAEMVEWAGKEPSERLQELKAALEETPIPGLTLDGYVKGIKDEFKDYEGTASNMCSLKKQLMCEKGNCVDCIIKSDGDYCDNAKKIAEASDKDPKKEEPKTEDPKKSGSGGGWMVRPVDGALLVALLAVFSLST
jgi:hypothetical protein